MARPTFFGQVITGVACPSSHIPKIEFEIQHTAQAMDGNDLDLEAFESKALAYEGSLCTSHQNKSTWERRTGLASAGAGRFPSALAALWATP